MSDWNWSPPSEPPAFEADPTRPEFLAPEPPPPAPAEDRRVPPWPRRAALGAAGLAALVLAGVVGGVVGANLAEDRPAAAPALSAEPVIAPGSASGGAVKSPAGNGTTDVRAVLAKVEPSVVAIAVTGRQGGGQGTGIILTPNGEVLTNAHVVEGARTIRVTVFGENDSRRAELVGLDSSNDLALVRIQDASGLPAAELGSSASLAVGDDVVAVGNALGLRGDPSVTRGIVSGLGRSLDSLTSLIQTDAAINPGNSGGPLVDAGGRVVGINTAVAGRGGQNIGFAIPIDGARPVIERLRTGAPARATAFLGITTSDTEDGSRGAQVIEVTAGGPAASAGMRAGDRIVEIAGVPVVGSSELVGILRQQLAPGQQVPVKVMRDGSEVALTVTLGERPDA
ncbi:MAG TPA: trypsin-like peptidase domain-containing protein [Acidimicrobiia bacterium]|jgi:putative serine protease PepD